MVIIGKDTVLQGTLGSPRVEGGAASSDVNRNFLRCSIRVSNLEESIKFYCQHFGFLVQKMLDVPEEAEEQRAFLTASDTSSFILELIEDSSAPAVIPGDWFVHFTLIVPSTADIIERLKESGHEKLILDEKSAVIPIRSLSPDGGQSTQDIVALVKDIDNYTWQIMEAKRSGVVHEPLCSVTLRTTSIEKTLNACSRVLGTTVTQSYEASRGKEYKTAMIGFGPELERQTINFVNWRDFLVVQLEFRQTETPPLIQRGNGVVRLVVGCSDLAATEIALRDAEEVVQSVEVGSGQEPGGKERALATVLEPDGIWELYFVSV